MIIGASALPLVFILDQHVSFLESAFLFPRLIADTVFCVTQWRRQLVMIQDEYASEIKPFVQIARDWKPPVQIVRVIVGLALLILGS